MLTAREEARLLERLRAARARAEDKTPTLEAAQNELFAPYLPGLVAYCRRIVGDARIGEELAQEAMLLAWQRIPEFEGRSRFSTYIYSIARNLCYQTFRHKTECLTDDGLFEVASEEASTFKRLSREERRAIVAAAISDLDQLDQEAVMLRYGEDLPYDVIERLLDLEKGGMKSGARGVLQRCKRTFRRALRARLAAVGVGTSFLYSER